MSRLILPRRFQSQPQAAVEIDSANPVTSRLGFAWSAATAVEVKTRAARTTDNTTKTVSVKGIAADCNAGQTNLEWNRQFCTTSDSAGTGDFTFTVLANPAATGGGTVEHVFSQKNDAAAPFAQAFLGAHTNAGAGYASGSFAFFTYNGDASAVAAAGVCDGNWHLWTGVRRSGVLELYKDDVLIASSSLPVRSIIQADTRFTAVGSRGNGATESYRDQAAFAGMWDRALSAKEVVGVSENPWQLFRNKPRVVYFDVGATASASTQGQSRAGARVLSAQIKGAITSLSPKSGASCAVSGQKGVLSTLSLKIGARSLSAGASAFAGSGSQTANIGARASVAAIKSILASGTSRLGVRTRVTGTSSFSPISSSGSSTLGSMVSVVASKGSSTAVNAKVGAVCLASSSSPLGKVVVNDSIHFYVIVNNPTI